MQYFSNKSSKIVKRL